MIDYFNSLMLLVCDKCNIRNNLDPDASGTFLGTVTFASLKH